MWILCKRLGYVVNFHPSQGAKNGMSMRAIEKAWGLGETVALSLLDVLPKETCYRAFMDNFFTFFRLFECLATKNIRENFALTDIISSAMME